MKGITFVGIETGGRYGCGWSRPSLVEKIAYEFNLVHRLLTNKKMSRKARLSYLIKCEYYGVVEALREIRVRIFGYRIRAIGIEIEGGWNK